MKKGISLILILSLVLVLLAGCSGSNGNANASQSDTSSSPSSSPSPSGTPSGSPTDSDVVVVGDKEYNVIFNSNMPAVSEFSDDAGTRLNYAYPAHSGWFFSEVTRRTGGKVKFELHYNAELFSSAAMLDALIGGSLDMGMTTMHTYGETVPEGFLNNLPGWAETPMDAVETLRGTDLWSLFDEGLREVGVIPTHIVFYGNYGFLSKEPIYTIDDFKGKLIRASGGLMKLWFDSLGLSSVNISITESYDSLQKGITEVDSLSFSGIDSMKFGEVCKYYVYPAFHQANATTFVFSQKFWDSLPKEYQDIILEVGEQAEYKCQEIQMEIMDEVLESDAAKYDMTRCDFQEMDELIDSMSVMYDAWADMSPRCNKMAQILRDHIAERAGG